MSKKRQFDYGDRIARTRRKHEYFGTIEPACSVCGENRVALLEKHHIAGRAYDPATMILCKNHHALMTEFQKDFPAGADDSPNALECIGRMLLNLAELFAILVEKFKEFGIYFIELARKESEGAGS